MLSDKAFLLQADRVFYARRLPFTQPRGPLNQRKVVERTPVNIKNVLTAALLIVTLSASANAGRRPVELSGSKNIGHSRVQPGALKPAQPVRQPPVAQTASHKMSRPDVIESPKRIHPFGKDQTNVAPGFLFINGHVVSPSATLFWDNGQLTIDDQQHTLLAFNDATKRLDSYDFAQPLSDVREPLFDSSPSQFVSAEEAFKIQRALTSGGIVLLDDNEAPVSLHREQGGGEIIEAFVLPPGEARNQKLDEAFARADYQPSRTTAKWLGNYEPFGPTVDRLNAAAADIQSIETNNMAVSFAIQQMDYWSYPITLAAMLVCVFAVGTLLSARPHEMVLVADGPGEVPVSRYLWLIAGMSVIDLVWTLLAFQANVIDEINPIGGVLLSNAARTAGFKLCATGLAIGILYRLRDNPLARKATWWLCLLLAMLMGRWILISGVSG